MIQSLNCLRDTPAGQLLRNLGFRTWLLYPEETPEYQIPVAAPVETEAETQDKTHFEKVVSNIAATEHVPQGPLARRLSERGVSDMMVVTWKENDPDYPRNWSNAKKNWILFVILVYTFVVYCGASIIAPTAAYAMARYNVSEDVASLGLSMYVVGYGIGPMFFSPISEIPFVGRNPPYLISVVLFFIVSIIMAVVDNFPALIVLRFLQGLFGSPALVSGAASLEDIYDMYSAPYGYVWWIGAMYCGPSFGPLLAGYAVVDNWRWAVWEMVIMAGIVLVLVPFLPETWGPKILLARAKRLRQRTGTPAYMAASELKDLNFGTTLVEALSKPIEIAIKDPAIGYACIYCAIVYATYYSFFEAFPIVYVEMYGMTQGGLGLIFTALSVGCIVGAAAYTTYIRFYFIPRARRQHELTGKPIEPEIWLEAGLVGVWGVPAGLLVFAYTARQDIHWIAPTTGIAIWAAFSFAVFQSIVCWLPPTYPRYVASLFASNDFTRSLLAAGFVQFTRPMYIRLGIDRGVTILAGLSFLGVLGHYGLYFFGAKLRARSRFTDKAAA